MAIRFYVVPKNGTGIPSMVTPDPYRPKYFANALGQALVGVPDSNAFKDFGLEPWFLVKSDVTPAEHAALVANSDVVALPVDLDQTVGQNLATVQSALEARGFPSDWANASTTYRQLLVVVVKCCEFAQRMHHDKDVRLFPPGITLSSTVGSLSAAQRQRMADVISGMGGTASEITAGMTMRAALKNLIDQLPDNSQAAVKK